MESFLWGVAFTLIIIVVGIFFYKAKQTETHIEKVVLYGFGFFAFTGTLITIFMLLSIPGLWALTFQLRFLLFILLFEVTVKQTHQCWVCDTPFDESKPTKPFQKEQIEEIEVEKKIKGNKA